MCFAASELALSPFRGGYPASAILSPSTHADRRHLRFLVAVDQPCGAPIELVRHIERMLGEFVHTHARQQHASDPQVDFSGRRLLRLWFRYPKIRLPSCAKRLDDRERPLGDLMVAVIDWFLDGGHLKETLPQLPPATEQERKPGKESPSAYSLAEVVKRVSTAKAAKLAEPESESSGSASAKPIEKLARRKRTRAAEL